MATRRLSAEQAADAMARNAQYAGLGGRPRRRTRGELEEETQRSRFEAEASVPEEETEEGERKLDWRKRMRESKAMLDAAPATARGYDELVKLGGTIKRNPSGKIVVEFPEGGMRRR